MGLIFFETNEPFSLLIIEKKELFHYFSLALFVLTHSLVNLMKYEQLFVQSYQLDHIEELLQLSQKRLHLPFSQFLLITHLLHHTADHQEMEFLFQVR